jgi:3-hydroxyisobutyrate dehydrogenase-like beta-hydroxyacid dehydrogenase
MVGQVVSMVYAHKMSLDVGMYANKFGCWDVCHNYSTGACRYRSLYLHVDNILMRDSDPGFSVAHFVKDLGINLKKL